MRLEHFKCSSVYVEPLNYNPLNDKQLKSLTKFMSASVMNNQEVHPSDIPKVIAMFKILAERGYGVSEEQIDIICESLHSLASPQLKTSDYLKEFLKDMAATFRYYVYYTKQPVPFKTPLPTIVMVIKFEKAPTCPPLSIRLAPRIYRGPPYQTGQKSIARPRPPEFPSELSTYHLGQCLRLPN